MYNICRMVGFILLLIGIFIAGIPVGIVAIVHSGRAKGKLKAILLPLSILGLLVTLAALIGNLSSDKTALFVYFYLAGMALSITTLSVAVHYRRKANNKVFDDKKKEHEESVLRTNNQIEYYDEIKKLKELFDSGAITEEEYKEKKSEILNRTK